jgi:hypothetical protein
VSWRWTALTGAICCSLVLAACGSGGKHSSQAVFRDFALVRPGITFELHPDERHILISADADAPLKVCEVGTSFADSWRGGCRELGERELSLPATSGAMHVVFRVKPMSGTSSRVNNLTLRWHCVDHRFWLHAVRSALPRTRPVFDC